MFGRKRDRDDFFERAAQDRRVTEDQEPWFLAPDDGPALDVDAGRSARTEDLPEGDGR